MRSVFGILRSIYKWVYHKISGTCQLQRLTLQADRPRIQMSIRCSKQLRRITPKILSKQYNQQVFEEICAIKNISNKETKQKFKVLMSQINNIYKFVNEIEKIILTKYDSTNNDHEQKLMQIWTNLKPNQQLQGRLSTQWIDVGFQDKDPATDFRGAGIMGLYNLNLYSKTKQGKQTFQTSSNTDTQYFFASASLYMTLLSYHLIRQRRFDKLIYHSSQVQNLFQEIFSNIFTSFNQYWKKCSDKSMMNTNNNLNNFSSMLRSKSPQQLIWFLGFGEVN